MELHLPPRCRVKAGGGCWMPKLTHVLRLSWDMKQSLYQSCDWLGGARVRTNGGGNDQEAANERGGS